MSNWYPSLRAWLSYPGNLRFIGDPLARRQVSRAISIASKPAPINPSLADEIGTTKTGQDE